MNAQLLIAAAGLGRRLGREMPKALVPVGGRALVAIAVERLLPLDWRLPIVVVIPEGFEGAFHEALDALSVPIAYVVGGAERQQSVMCGLDALHADTEIVAIHDAARPFVGLDAVRGAVEAAEQYGAATVATPVSDTILVSDGAGGLVSTPDRRLLWACQTPQVFQVSILRAAHAAALRQGAAFTDDASLVRAAGHAVRLIDGGPGNFKITTPHDLSAAAFFLKQGE